MAWEEWEAWVVCQEEWEVWVDSKCHQDLECQELPEQEPLVLEALLLILDHHVKNMQNNLLKSKKYIIPTWLCNVQ